MEKEIEEKIANLYLSGKSAMEVVKESGKNYVIFVKNF